MIRSLRRFFEQEILSASAASVAPDQHKHACQLASAALLVEMTKADFAVHPTERTHVVALLRSQFALNQSEVEELVERANQRSSDATSLHEFTGLINEHFDADDKTRLIRMLWDVAIADGNIDKYEDYLVRKVADLLYVPHSEFIRTKHAALEQV